MSFFGNVANRFGWARPIWEAISRPSIYFPLGALVLGGFVAGVTFWGAFNTALEATNSERFCTGCHEMRSNVFEELKSTIHFSNRSGVRASCPDCHVPHNWTDKIARKMQASKEVWGHLFGNRWTWQSSRRARWKRTSDSFSRARKPASIVTRASRTDYLT